MGDGSKGTQWVIPFFGKPTLLLFVTFYQLQSAESESRCQCTFNIHSKSWEGEILHFDCMCKEGIFFQEKKYECRDWNVNWGENSPFSLSRFGCVIKTVGFPLSLQNKKDLDTKSGWASHIISMLKNLEASVMSGRFFFCAEISIVLGNWGKWRHIILHIKHY